MSHTTTANDPPPPCPFDIGVLADRLANAGRSAHTVRAYQRAWRKLQAWCAAEKTTPLTLDRNSAAKAYDFLANGTATASRVQFLAAIRYAYQEWNSPNPFAALDKPKHDISRTPPCYLTAEQAARLLGTLESHKDKGYFHGLCYQLATFLLFTATRFHEPTQLTWDDVIRKNSVPIAIHLIGKGGKAVDVPLVGKLGAKLQEWEAYQSRAKSIRLMKGVASVGFCRSRYIFAGRDGKPLSNQAFNKRLHNACVEAGIKPITAPALRHTAATLLLGEGRDIREVQEVLRHRSISTTARYLHIDHTKKRKLYETLEAAI